MKKGKKKRENASHPDRREGMRNKKGGRPAFERENAMTGKTLERRKRETSYPRSEGEERVKPARSPNLKRGIVSRAKTKKEQACYYPRGSDRLASCGEEGLSKLKVVSFLFLKKRGYGHAEVVRKGSQGTAGSLF